MGIRHPPEATSRRDFVRLMTAGLSLGGLVACGRPPPEKLVPYTRMPPGLTPGVPLHYATSMVLDGFAIGLIAQSREGRPVKIEGNPEHPASLGAAGVFEQAWVLPLYDPARLKRIEFRGVPMAWRNLAAAIGASERGARVRLVLEPTASPLRVELLDRLREHHPNLQLVFHAPARAVNEVEAATVAYGERLQFLYDLERVDLVVALDSDFLDAGPFRLRYARQFADRRRLNSPEDDFARLYVAEPRPTCTGSLADERLPCRRSAIAGIAAELLAEIAGADVLPVAARTVLGQIAETGCLEDHRDWARKAAAELLARRGRSLVVVGEHQPWPVHVLGHVINDRLGNFGTTVFAVPSVLYDEGTQSIELLVEQMRAGEVDRIIIAGVNPCHTTPSDLQFSHWLATVPESFYLGEYSDETARACQWLVPAAHGLESWGDARAPDGTISFLQPLLRPLFTAKTPDEVLAAMLGRWQHSAYELLHELWQPRLPAADGAGFLEEPLARGLLADSRLPTIVPELRKGALNAAVMALLDGSTADAAGFELTFHVDHRVYDGRFANNGWLLDLPDPITKLTWTNAVLMSPATAVDLGVDTGDLVDITVDHRQVRAPAVVVPGHADKTLSVDLGYGRIEMDGALHDQGFDAYRLLPGPGSWFRRSVAIVPTDSSVRLPYTQQHFRIHGREIALEANLEDWRRNPELTRHLRGPLPSLIPQWDYEGHQWGMMIDLTLCTGCSACVVACQAENNIPVVGADAVTKNREMHWLRIDRYYIGDASNPGVINQPMLCQHCERAPCEYVCPVNATVHSPDGLNEMIYNRCIGTRFCSNNCPYKVRRFNWIDLVDDGLVKLQRNPDVTVRERGVMEKCTYCVQRIRRAGIVADRENRPLRDGEVLTACQQTCPTHAISFGDIHDPTTEVSRWRQRPHRYAVLHEQGTAPRTQYLVKVVASARESG